MSESYYEKADKNNKTTRQDDIPFFFFRFQPWQSVAFLSSRRLVHLFSITKQSHLSAECSLGMILNLTCFWAEHI